MLKNNKVMIYQDIKSVNVQVTVIWDSEDLEIEKFKFMYFSNNIEPEKIKKASIDRLSRPIKYIKTIEIIIEDER